MIFQYVPEKSNIALTCRLWYQMVQLSPEFKTIVNKYFRDPPNDNLRRATSQVNYIHHHFSITEKIDEVKRITKKGDFRLDVLCLFTGLNNLALANNTEYHDFHIGHLGDLVSLYISDYRLSVDFFVQIRHLRNLESLVLSNCDVGSYLEAFCAEAMGVSKDSLRHYKQERLKAVVDSEVNVPIASRYISDKNCLNLQILSLENCNLTNVVSLMSADMPNMKILILQSNKITYLPELAPNQFKMTQLTKLVLSDNQIGKLPSFVYKLAHLQLLDISRNNLTEISADIGYMESLRRLEISHNNIVYMPDSIDSAKVNTHGGESESLLPSGQQLRSNNFFGSSNNIQYTSIITILNVSRCKLSDLPSAIAKFTSMRALIAHSNNFTRIPECVYELRSLKVLRMNKCKIRKIDDSISNLRNLYSLSLSDNRIDKISVNLKGLKYLSCVNLSGNKITNLSTGKLFVDGGSDGLFSIFKQPMLTIDLDRNKITEIDKSITGLCAGSLKLRYNNISHISDGVLACSVEDMYLTGNNIDIIPEYLFEAEIKTIYFDRKCFKLNKDLVEKNVKRKVVKWNLEDDHLILNLLPSRVSNYYSDDTDSDYKTSWRYAGCLSDYTSSSDESSSYSDDSSE